MKILFCDIDSTINNHWVRIQKWAQPSFPGTSIHQKAFTREEIMKDLPIEKLDFMKSYEFENSIDYLLEILKDDKKSKSDSIDIVLLSDISQPNLISISFDELIEVIQN